MIYHETQTKMKTLLFATSNAHKLDEIRAILPTYQIWGLHDAGIMEDIEETGATLEENALIKAMYLFNKTGIMSLSEDTGLEVDVLHGAPGVKTARYAGEEKDPEKNMAKLLEVLQHETNRKAQFRTVIACVSQDNIHYFEGLVRGTIARSKSGEKGFGYDPLFIPEGFSDSFAVLDQAIKNKISHRAKAVQALVSFLDKSDQIM